mmetsp:Transcript_46481/g.140819  ORF Transcript_46481/g.140819 Transcript_46481/m.140819 type:complete len:86 (+) Transcript_46481:1296-1553(+)
MPQYRGGESDQVAHDGLARPEVQCHIPFEYLEDGRVPLNHVALRSPPWATYYLSGSMPPMAEAETEQEGQRDGTAAHQMLGVARF